MKQILLAVAVTISSGTIPINSTQAFWAVFGPIDVSTQTVSASTTPVSNVSAPIILKSDTTPDCGTLKMYPNGNLYTVWTPCK